MKTIKEGSKNYTNERTNPSLGKRGETALVRARGISMRREIQNISDEKSRKSSEYNISKLFEEYQGLDKRIQKLPKDLQKSILSKVLAGALPREEVKEHVRKGIAEAIGVLGDRTVVPALKEMLPNPQIDKDVCVMRCLKQLGF